MTTPRDPSAVRARLAIVLAALLWSTSGAFAGHPCFDAWPVEQRGMLLAFWRSLFAGLLVLPLVRRPQWSPLLIPMTLCFALMSATFLSAMTLSTAANAIWLQNTGPFWVLLISVVILRQPLRRDDLLLVVFSALGVALILNFELRGQSPAGVVLGLITGMCYAVVILFFRQLRGVPSAWLAALNLLVTALVLLPWVIQYGVWPTGEQLLILAAFGLFQMGIPYILFAYGMRTLSGPQGAGLLLLEPLLVPVWVYLLWGRTTPWWTLGGGALILAGLAAQILLALHVRRPV